MMLVIDPCFQASIGVVDTKDGQYDLEIFTDTASRFDLLIFFKNTLQKYGLDLKNVETIAIGIGPGSFTGLRMGTSFVKGFCLATKIPLIGINIFEAIREKYKDHYPAPSHIMPVICGNYQHFYYESMDTEYPHTAPITQLLGIATNKSAIPIGNVPQIDSIGFEIQCDASTLIPLALKKRTNQQFVLPKDISPLYFKSPKITIQKKNIL